MDTATAKDRIPGVSDRPRIDKKADPRGWAREVSTYHPPTEEARRRHEAINLATEEFIVAILKHTPECADQSAALRLARDARHTANAAIALNGLT